MLGKRKRENLTTVAHKDNEEENIVMKVTSEDFIPASKPSKKPTIPTNATSLKDKYGSAPHKMPRSD